MYTGGDTTRFLGMWLGDSSHRNTVARVLPGHGKIVKHWPVRRYKRVGGHCLSAYLSNTYCRYKRLLGTPIAFSVMCSLWKIRPIFLDLLQTFCELMIKGEFKLWWFPERSHSSTNQNNHFLGLEKVTTFVWHPTIVAEKLGYINKWRPLGSHLFDCPQTPVLDPALPNIMSFHFILLQAEGLVKVLCSRLLSLLKELVKRICPRRELIAVWIRLGVNFSIFHFPLVLWRELLSY